MGTWLLLMMLARFAPTVRADAEPASSNVPPTPIVAVTSAPTAPVDATLKRSVPPLTTSALLGPSVAGASISSVPLPDFASVPELTIVPEKLVVVD